MKIVDAVTMAEMLRFGMVAELDVTEMGERERENLNQLFGHALNVCAFLSSSWNSFAARLKPMFAAKTKTTLRWVCRVSTNSNNERNDLAATEK